MEHVSNTAVNLSNVTVDFRKVNRKEIPSELMHWSRVLSHGSSESTDTVVIESIMHCFGLDESSDCLECITTPEDLEPEVFPCPRFMDKRRWNHPPNVVIGSHNLIEE